MKPQFRFEFAFPRNYEVKVLNAAPPLHPLEKLYHYPVELDEGDRSGVYVRIEPRQAPPWRGFFALGFESDRVIHAAYSCPDRDSVCIVSGGYAYVVNAMDPSSWFRVEQRPAVDIRALPEPGLLLFVGFTTITAVGRTGIAWTTQRLSWEGISIVEITGEKLRGTGWDALTDKNVPFEVDLLSGASHGGARPQSQQG